MCKPKNSKVYKPLHLSAMHRVNQMGLKLNRVERSTAFGKTNYTVFVKPTGLEGLLIGFRSSLPRAPAAKEIAHGWLEGHLNTDIDPNRMYVFYSHADGAYKCQLQLRDEVPPQ